MIEITSKKALNSYNIEERARLTLDPITDKVEIKENNEELVTFDNEIVVEPFWDDEKNIEGDAYLQFIDRNKDFQLVVRSSVKEKLELASKTLPSGWKIIVKAGYRPIEVQKTLFFSVLEYLKRKRPNKDAEDILKEARLLVSDPALTVPPHSTGGAVDIDVRDANGELVDFGCRPNTDGDIAHTFSTKITNSQQENRLTLLKAMLQAGFANLAHEWWHFSYGDQYWATFYDKKHALYDTVKN